MPSQLSRTQTVVVCTTLVSGYHGSRGPRTHSLTVLFFMFTALRLCPNCKPHVEEI